MVWRHVRALSTSSSTLTPARAKSSDNKMPEKLACIPRFTASRIKENLALVKQKDWSIDRDNVGKKKHEEHGNVRDRLQRHGFLEMNASESYE